MKLFARKGSPLASDPSVSVPPHSPAPDFALPNPAATEPRSRRRWLGLDIGSTAVRVVELSRRRRTYRVEACAVEPVPPGSVVAGNISDARAVGEAIRQACRRSGAKAKNVSVGVANSAVITKTIEMDAGLSDDEMESEIAQVANRHIPFPIDDVAIDFEPMHRLPRDPAKVEVMLAACRMEHVARRREAIEQGGLTVRVVDVESHALHRAVEYLAPDEVPVALADVGATRSTLLLVAGEESIFVREEPFDASALRRTDARSRTAREDLLRLLERLLRLVVLASPFEQVDRLLLAGSTASSPGLADDAAQRLGMPVEVADPFAGMAFSKHADHALVAEHAPALLMACGLALRGFAEGRR